MILELSAIVSILIHPRTIRWAKIGALSNIPSGAEISTVGIDGLSESLLAIGFLTKEAGSHPI
jgi:hypothetical protein